MKKHLKLIITIVTCLAMALTLVGCSQSKTSTTSSASSSSTTVSKSPFYVLLVGNDTRTGTVEANKAMYADGNARSDVMMLVRVDPSTYTITLVSIARDTEAVIDGQKTKINVAYQNHGMDGAVQAAEDLTGEPIKYWFNINFVQFENFVNKLGGVDVDVPLAISLQDIVNGDTINLSAGNQTLNGPDALVLARVRKDYVNQDSTRQYNDRNLVEAFMQKALKNPTQVASYITDLTSCATTNMPASDITDYVNAFVTNSSKVTFQTGSGPDVGSIDAETQLYLVPRDTDTWTKLMKVVDAGGDPNSVYPLPTIALA